MTQTLVDCGCETKVYADGSGVEVYYCPMHSAAPEMYDALLELVEAFKNGELAWKHKRQSDSDPYHPASVKLFAAIAKAEGN